MVFSVPLLWEGGFSICIEVLLLKPLAVEAVTCIPYGVPGIVPRLDLRWLFLAGGQLLQLSFMLRLARKPTVCFPTVDMASHLLFCWS